MAVYDAFVSYSHAKDKPIAAALQSVIQKLGKPWYRRRALRLFRDDTSLSATPHLWPSIEKALSESRFLILFASPEAAASKWVNKEVDYWLKHNSIDTLLIGLTDGELIWDETTSDFRWCGGMPLPSMLSGRFPTEPKWVRLCAYRDGANPRDANFIELGAEFAATIRGMPKEDLLSQEVRQQRRALTLAWSAAGSLLFLACLAAWQWKAAHEAEQLAIEQRKEAEVHRDNATRNFELAKGTADSLVIDIAQGLRDVEGMRANSVRKILATAKLTFERLVASDPGNLDLQRSRGIMLLEFGNTYLIVSDLAAAHDSYDAGRAIFERLIAHDPSNGGWQRDLSVAWARISKVLKAEGKLMQALAAYRTALAIRERLVTSEPLNADWQRDVALAQEGIGVLLEAQRDFDGALEAYRAALAVRQRLVASDPEHAGCRCELASSWRNIGNVLNVQQKLDEALDAYRISLAIVERLVESDPTNTDWQRDLALSLAGIGTQLEAKGDRTGALDAHRTALAVRERLAKADPDNVQWQTDLMSSHWRLAELGDDSARRYSFIADTLRRLKERNKLTPDQEGMLPEVEARLAKLRG